MEEKNSCNRSIKMVGVSNNTGSRVGKFYEQPVLPSGYFFVHMTHKGGGGHIE